MNVEKLILLVKDHEAIHDASDSYHRNRDYIASLWAKIAHEMDVGMWRALLFFACYNDDDNKNNSHTISDKVVDAVFIRPYISNSPTLFLV
jgi:hypothetical protein